MENEEGIAHVRNELAIFYNCFDLSTYLPIYTKSTSLGLLRGEAEWTGFSDQLPVGVCFFFSGEKLTNEK
jgi:hypothetical protein